MTPAETFEKAYAAYVPELSDLSEVLAYRTWKAMKSTLETHAPDALEKIGGPYGEIMHEIMCSHAKTLKEALHVASFYDRAPLEEPRHRIFYDCEPDVSESAIEKRALRIFETQFRARYPGERKGGKLWIAKKVYTAEQAKKFAREQLEAEHGEYLAKKNAFDAKQYREREEWMLGVHGLALRLDGLRDIQMLGKD